MHITDKQFIHNRLYNLFTIYPPIPPKLSPKLSPKFSLQKFPLPPQKKLLFHIRGYEADIKGVSDAADRVDHQVEVAEAAQTKVRSFTSAFSVIDDQLTKIDNFMGQMKVRVVYF